MLEMFRIAKKSSHTRSVIEKAKKISGDSRGANVIRDHAVAYEEYLQTGNKKVLQKVRAKYRPEPHETSPALKARHDLKNINIALKQYKTVYSQYPEGSVQKKIKALKGENPDNITFLGRLSGSDKDETGDKKFAADPWGTPYRITIQEDNTVVTSAGADKEFGTKDDLSSEDIDRN